MRVCRLLEEHDWQRRSQDQAGIVRGVGKVRRIHRDVPCGEVCPRHQTPSPRLAGERSGAPSPLVHRTRSPLSGPLGSSRVLSGPLGQDVPKLGAGAGDEEDGLLVVEAEQRILALLERSGWPTSAPLGSSRFARRRVCAACALLRDALCGECAAACALRHVRCGECAAAKCITACALLVRSEAELERGVHVVPVRKHVEGDERAEHRT